MKNDGTLVPSTIRPNAQGDTYATAISNEIRGGHHTYQTYVELENIPYERRQWGMIATIIDDETTYQLKPIITNNLNDNNNWDVFNSGAITLVNNDSWLDIAIDIIDVLPGSPIPGDRYVVSENTASSQLVGKNNYIATFTTQLGWVFDEPKDSQAINIRTKNDVIYKFKASINKWVPYHMGALPIKYVIDTSETLIIQENYEYLIYGDLFVNGTIINYGRLVVLNGAIINQNNITTLGNGVIIDVNV